jgi:hypothetical protein
LRAQNAVAIEAVAGMRGKMEDATWDSETDGAWLPPLRSLFGGLEKQQSGHQ